MQPTSLDGRWRIHKRSFEFRGLLVVTRYFQERKYSRSQGIPASQISSTCSGVRSGLVYVSLMSQFKNCGMYRHKDDLENRHSEVVL